ncbi:hypothetical protein Pint_26103 [Pistacia integerrima]|uniref:Uncharacterized protein n=1 Tax=Pistacia integerrima TaxID=434235 RepID=A0ACC0YCB2_9ROSI|nr:hypothetical protein Pint_26103 [Pistacia integerrima]
MIGDLQVVRGVKKLNDNNYDKWATCMESYLQGSKNTERSMGHIHQTFFKEERYKTVAFRKQATTSYVMRYDDCSVFPQGWSTQPSLVEFENLLAGHETMAKQIAGVSLKGEEEAFYINKSKTTLNNMLEADLKRMVTRQKVIKEREALIQGEIQRIATIVKELRANVITMARNDTLEKIAGP